MAEDKEKNAKKFYDLNGAEIIFTGEKEFGGYKIGDKLEPRFKNMPRHYIPEILSAKNIEVVGFTLALRVIGSNPSTPFGNTQAVVL